MHIEHTWTKFGCNAELALEHQFSREILSFLNEFIYVILMT